MVRFCSDMGWRYGTAPRAEPDPEVEALLHFEPVVDEPERPPEPEHGRHDDEIATGPPMECQRTDPDLDFSEWRHRQDRRNALAAEAQRAFLVTHHDQGSHAKPQSREHP